MPEVATKVTKYSLETERVISTGSIKVYGVLFTNLDASPRIATLKDNDDNVLMILVGLTNVSADFVGSWIADNGLKVASAGSASSHVTIIHSADGI